MKSTMPINKFAGNLPVREKGFAVFVAMVVLLAMTFAGIALVRSVDTGAMVAGNLAFRQSATASADFATETARSWLLSANSSALQSDSSSNGYYATSQDYGSAKIDLTGSFTKHTTADDVRWMDNDGIVQPGLISPVCASANDTAGNRVCYVIHRLCQNPGPFDTATCTSTQGAPPGGASMGGMQQIKTDQNTLGTLSGQPMGFYRITIRVGGPRHNVSVVQVFMQVQT